MQSGYGVNFLFWRGEFEENCRRISQRILLANFDSEFFGLVFPGLVDVSDFFFFSAWGGEGESGVAPKSPRNSHSIHQKNPRAHKNIIGTSPPPPSNPKSPPPQNEEFYGHGGFSCRKKAFLPGVHKIGAAISGPRIADTNFMDTRIFLN